MRKQLDFWERLDLPDEHMPGQVLVEIAGTNRVLIEHHHGVQEYSDEKICVSVKYGHIQVLGENLRLCAMTKAQLVISGKIESIALKRRCDR